MKQNITLRIDKDLINKSKVIVARKDTSVSKPLDDELKKLIDHSEEYEFVKRKARANLKARFHLGGRIRASKEESHEK